MTSEALRETEQLDNPGSVEEHESLAALRVHAEEDSRVRESSGQNMPSLDAFGRIGGIPLEITVELGRTRLLIRDILALNVGSILELDKIAGEPVDLLANGALVARGEVVVIDNNFGVRLIELVSSTGPDGIEAEHARAV